jgi:hypothetical protein
VLAPSSGLDPALKAHADGLRAQGRQFVYGFLLLRAPSSDALEKKLAGLGVELLGPHDDHQKARLPIGSLHAIAALPDVEWIGVSSPKQKQSLELTALRGSEAKAPSWTLRLRSRSSSISSTAMRAAISGGSSKLPEPPSGRTIPGSSPITRSPPGR